MSENSLKITYKIYLDAEDVAQSRILSCASGVKNIIKNHKNPYINRAEVENDSDMDEFILNLYVKEEIEEAECENVEQAEAFLDELAVVLDEIAHLHSFLDMEGSFSIDFEGEHIAYTFSSEPGYGHCDFTEQM